MSCLRETQNQDSRLLAPYYRSQLESFGVPTGSSISILNFVSVKSCKGIDVRAQLTPIALVTFPKTSYVAPRILRRAGQVNEMCRFPLLARMLASESVDSVPLTAQTDSVRAREEQCEQNDGSTSVYRASQRGHKVMEEGPSIALPW